MKLAIISTMGGVPWGGSEELWAAAAREAVGAGHRVSAFLWRVRRGRRLRAEELARMGVKVREYAPPDGAWQKWRSTFTVRHPRAATWWARLLHPSEPIFRGRPDVVLLSLGDTYVLGMHRAYHVFVDELIRRSIPYVIVNQLAVDDWRPDVSAADVTRRAFKHARRVGFVSEHNRALVERQLGVSLVNATVVRNPVNMADVSAVAWPGEGTARLACVSRLQLFHKGQDVLLAALADERWRGRDWRLRLYGAGPDEAKVRALIGEHPCGDRIELAGHAADVRGVWAENHLLVMPSLMEGTPLAMVEAMLCGRPGVYSPAGGIPEWIEDGVSGVLASSTQPAEFAEALERGWQAREQWRPMGEAARARALYLYDPQPGRTLLQQLVEAAG